MIAYLEAKRAEIDAQAFLCVRFDVHHGALRRAKVERTDEFGDAANERLSA